jgi:hypothetical protein
LEDLDVDVRIILKWTLKKNVARVWPGDTEVRVGTNVWLLLTW